MTKIFKNMAPYWYMIVAIVLLLIVQAFGDLSLPQYTSDIIDVGIQNKGVEHILPVKMTEDEYEISQLYMTSKEKKVWKDTYEKWKAGEIKAVEAMEITQLKKNSFYNLVKRYEK